MNSNQVILWMIIGCFVFLGLIFLIKPLKLVTKVCLNSIIGIAVLLITNFVLTPLDISVGINILNALIVGILGIPGIISLYIINIIL